MIDINIIDEAIAKVSETLITGGYSVMPYNLMRIFRLVYGYQGAYYFINERISEFRSVDEWECRKGRTFPDYYKERFRIFHAIAEKYPGVIRRGFDTNGMLFTDRFVYMADGYFMCRPEEALEIQEELTPFIPETPEDIPAIGYILQSNGRIDCSRIPINKMEEDISANYNDDIPTERLKEVLHEERSSISILHGIPGCGKTTYIRKLIADNKDLDFYWLDAKLLNLVTDESFISFLINHKDAVYVIEDCENLLRDREEGGNSALSSLLNISDGMLGDCLNIKFICTFNADLKNIDPAVLRKGRLRVKYEFKELAAEKVKALADKLGITIPEIKPMPLCEVYNFEQENGVKKAPERKRIGF